MVLYKTEDGGEICILTDWKALEKRKKRKELEALKNTLENTEGLAVKK